MKKRTAKIVSAGVVNVSIVEYRSSIDIHQWFLCSNAGASVQRRLVMWAVLSATVWGV